MKADSRADLARQAYLRALTAARVAPTPRRWRKLVIAARNLRTAERAFERRWLAAFPPAARRLAAARRAAALRTATLIPFPSRPPSVARVPVPAAPGAWASPIRRA
jgi:hypothetical protein